MKGRRHIVFVFVVAISTALPGSALSCAPSTHHYVKSSARATRAGRTTAKSFLSVSRIRGGGTNRRAISASTPSAGDSSSDLGKASIPNEVANLVKSIIGSGVLSLPAGIGAFGNSAGALFPATLLIAVLGGLSGYSFSLIARVCAKTGATSYADAWDKTRGSSTAWIVALSSAVDCFAGNLAYSMILADAFRDLAASVGLGLSRSHVLLAITATVLLPLCLVKNLSSLAPFSVLGIIGMAYTSIAIGIRFFGGAYALPAGKFLSDLSPDLQPTFGSTGASGVFHPSSLILVCMLSNAYIAHFNAPKFFAELKNNSIRRFNIMTSWSFAISIAIYAAVSAMAFLTFGSASQGLVLNNYSTKDVLMSFSRFAVALSIVFSYPLLFVGTRDGLLDLFKVSEQRRNNNPKLMNVLSVVTLSIITALALKLRDIGFVASISGAVLGNSLVFIFPALMFRASTRNTDEQASSISIKVERKLAGLLALLGIAVSAIGTWMTVKG